MTIQSNFSLQTPLYYRQFVWSQKCQKSYILYLYNTDTFVKRTLGSVPLVSVLKRFNCSYFEIMRAYSSEGNHGSRLCFTWWIITSQWIFSQSQWKNLNDKLQHYFISTMSHTILNNGVADSQRSLDKIFMVTIKFLPYSKTFMKKKTYITSDKHSTSRTKTVWYITKESDSLHIYSTP